MPQCKHRLAVQVAALFSCAAGLGNTFAQNATLPIPQEEIVVTATRLPTASVSAPASVDRVDVKALGVGLPLVDLSEVLSRVPGIVVQNRQNFAQDTQISARGFGARASFGIRGLKLFLDDIPASIPDGQGQGAIFPLFVIGSIEVLRGPWAVPFGNAAGGVISAQSIAPAPGVQGGFAMGPDRTRVSTLQAGASKGSFSGSVAAQRFSSDGYRAHSAVLRDQTYSRLDLGLDGGHHFKLTANLIHQPDTADPLGLTQAQFNANPRQAPAPAFTFNTRKSINHQQLGAAYGGGSGALTWKLVGYGGNRDVEQFLSTPASVQVAAASSGGVVSLDREFHGVSGKLSYAEAAWSATLGVEMDNASEVRRGYENFVTNGAVQTLGVRGRLRRDELNEQVSIDGYAYVDWAFASGWKAHAAIRSNRIVFKSADRYIVPGNGDDSGERRYHRLTPAIALVRSLTPTSNIYVSASSGFETPTAAELAYRPDRASGLNFALTASTNRQIELGVKARLQRAAINIAAFQVSTDDEIVPATATGGRTTFQNGGRTLRRGVESSFEYQMPDASLAARITYTGLRATLRDGYRVLDTGGRTIAAGSSMPAIPQHQFFAEISWRRGLPGLNAALEAQARSRVWADDGNTASASGYSVLHARAAYRMKWGLVELQPFARLENLLNRKYISSVIVNDANQRYFESAAARRWLAGINGSVRF